MPHATRRRLVAILVLAGTATLPASTTVAQWKRDPLLNLGISTAASDQNQAKVLPAADGSTVVVWLDGIATGWDTRVQRLDERGVAQYPGNGVLVADTAFSSTQDYGAALDAAGNALIAYRDDGNSGSPAQIRVQKVAPGGALLWGSGIQVSTVAGGNAPQCCASDDGGVIVAWSTATGAAAVQKVDADGVAQWAAGGVIDAPGAGLYFVCGVAPDGAGGAIVTYHHQTGGFSSPRHLKAQRFSAGDGAKLWNAGAPVVIFDGGSLQLGAFPALVSDGSGGIVTAWYSTAGTRNAYVQRLDANGTAYFAANGATVAVDVPGRIRISAAAAFDPASGETFMIAKESDATPQGNYSLIAQRFDAGGTRLWGATGAPVLAPGADQPGFDQVQSIGGGSAVCAWYSGGFNMQNVFALRLGPDGFSVWTSGIRTVSSVMSGKARLASAITATNGSLILAWADNRNDGNDIYGQRVNIDGSLGIQGDVNQDGQVNFADVLEVLGAWGRCPDPLVFCDGDLDGNGTVEFGDLLIVLGNWD